jgi:hypothetical protein
MSQSEDEPSCLQELAMPCPESPLIAPPHCENEALAPLSTNEDLGPLSSALIDNFVSPAPDDPVAIDQLVIFSPVAVDSVASNDVIAAELDPDDTGPDDSSSAVAAPDPTLMPTSAARENSEFEEQRLQLLREIRGRAAAFEEVLEDERERQHSSMLLALQRRKSKHNDDIPDVKEKDSASADSSSPHADPLNEQGSSTHNIANEDGRSGASAALCNENEDFVDPLRRSRSSSPVLIGTQRPRPDIRIDIPSPNSAVSSDIERSRDQRLSSHWQLRQQNVDSALYAQLAEMGFDSRIAIVALERTGSASLQEAIDFCLDHGNEDYSGAFRSDAFDSDGSSTADISVNLTCARSTLFSLASSCTITGATVKMMVL